MLAAHPDTYEPRTSPAAEALAGYLQAQGGQLTELLGTIAADLGLSREELGAARARLVDCGRMTEERRDPGGVMTGYTFTLTQGSLL